MARLRLDPEKISQLHLRRVVKTAGEVRFIKDRSDDVGQWAFTPPGASERAITEDFTYNPKNLRPLAKCLRATNSALGFALSAYNVFAKLQSRTVSGDGLLGGKGYVQKISDMRRQYMNCVEALSALSDTCKDEVDAPHWAEVSRQLPHSDQKEIQEDVEEANEIKDNPEGWAEEEMED